MLNILAYLREPERSAMRFERLGNDFSDVCARVADTPVEAQPALAESEVLISIGGHLGADAASLYARMPKLKWVQSFGSGTDNIKGHPALAPGVTVTNVHGIHGPQLSEAAFAAMLSFTRRMPQFTRNQDRQHWERTAPTLLSGTTVGIFGLGAIANELAPRCAAFGMRVVGISETVRDVPGFDQVYARGDILSAVADLDYLILLTPYTSETHHFLGREVFAAMKPGACLINLARGGVVDEAALLAALDAGEIAGAALDVFETEPLPVGHPLWLHPNVIVTPHNAGFHAGYPDQAYAAISANVARYLLGGAAALVNKV
jgi:D-2-hydroxyacid dehydrogenase (NADP+)